MIRVLSAVLCLLIAVLLSAGRTYAQGEDVPLEFRFVGKYVLDHRVKLKDGKPFPVAIGAAIYQVYTDGVSVRLYGEDRTEGFTEFVIYRNDGVVIRKGAALMETVAGVQARSMVGNVMRQITLTQTKLTLTKFPALSDIVQISYATRRSDESLSKVETQSKGKQ